MPFQAYMPGGLPGFSSPDEVTLARMREEERLKEQQFLANPVEEVSTVPAAPEGPGFLSRAVTNFGDALSQFGTSPIVGALGSMFPAEAQMFTNPPVPAGIQGTSISDLFQPKAALEKPWLDAPNKAARASAQAAERLTNVKSTPPAKAAQAVADTATASSRPTMLVTIDGKTYDYSDPNVRAPKLTGDTVNLRPRGPGAFASYYDPATKNVQVGQRRQEVATLPADKRPGVSVMESSARPQLLEYATRQRLGEARRGAERAEMSPREAAELDPRVMAERIKLQRPTDVQMAGQEFRKLYQDSFKAGEEAIRRALQQDPTLFTVYQNAKNGDKAADLAFREQAKKIYEAAQDEFLQSGISGLGRDIYRPDAMAAIR